MDAEKCRVLLEIITCGTLSGAADKLGYSPSGISRMMDALEREFGFRLLLRGRNGICPTRECETLLPRIREFVEKQEQLRLEVAGISGLIAGEISVGTPYPAYYDPFFRLIAKFNQQYPQVRVNILRGMSSALCAAVEDGNADFCIVSKRKGDFCWIPLRQDPLVVILSRNHPLTKQDSVPLSVLETEPFLLPSPDEETDVYNFLTAAGIRPGTTLPCQDIQAAYYMAAAGLGITLDNAIFASRFQDAVCTRPLDPPQNISIGIAAPRLELRSPAARKFLALAGEFFPAARARTAISFS